MHPDGRSASEPVSLPRRSPGGGVGAGGCEDRHDRRSDRPTRQRCASTSRPTEVGDPSHRADRPLPKQTTTRRCGVVGSAPHADSRRTMASEPSVRAHGRCLCRKTADASSSRVSTSAGQGRHLDGVARSADPPSSSASSTHLTVCHLRGRGRSRRSPIDLAPSRGHACPNLTAAVIDHAGRRTDVEVDPGARRSRRHRMTPMDQHHRPRPCAAGPGGCHQPKSMTSDGASLRTPPPEWTSHSMRGAECMASRASGDCKPHKGTLTGVASMSWSLGSRPLDRSLRLHEGDASSGRSPTRRPRPTGVGHGAALR